MSNYYEILGCERDASYEKIKKCYQEKAKKCHPDKSGSEHGEAFVKLYKAWETLGNESARREYDLTIRKQDIEETPLFCELDLTEMTYKSESGIYTYDCRCGGIYVVDESDVTGWEKLKVSCDDCTFHIIINQSK